MTCLWAGSATPRVLSGHHEPDCPGDCRGCQECPERSMACGIMSEAAGCVNTERPLTHSSDLSREGLAVKATPAAKVCAVEGCEKATLSAHRWSYTFFIDHVWDRGCRNRHCVNPDHLEAVTPAENSRRGWDVYKRKKAGLA